MRPASSSPDAPSLSSAEQQRYSRHMLLPAVGQQGQQALKAASVLIVGAGGLGSPVALYLAAAGVGRIGLVDFDAVDLTNLQRQILYGTSDVGRPKLDAARERLRDLNPHVQVDAHPVRLTRANARALIAEYDVVADGTDNFATRYLVNDACVLTGTPNVYASIYRFEGQASIFGLLGEPCYRCLFPEPPPPGQVPSCAEGGVLGVLPGLVGTIQATEVLKVLLGIGDTLAGRLLLIDTLAMDFRRLTVTRDPACPICGDAPTITELIDYEAFCGVPSTPDRPLPEMEPQALHARYQAGTAPFVIDVRRADEVAQGALPFQQHIPIEVFEDRLAEVAAASDDEIVVYCRSGARSGRAQQLLLAAGYSDVKNLRGGMLAWAADVTDTHAVS